MATESAYHNSDPSTSLFPSKVNQIRISPIKTRDSLTNRLSLKPISSSVLQ